MASNINAVMHTALRFEMITVYICHAFVKECYKLNWQKCKCVYYYSYLKTK